jgi:hypothetical protein
VVGNGRAGLVCGQMTGLVEDGGDSRHGGRKACGLQLLWNQLH